MKDSCILSRIQALYKNILLTIQMNYRKTCGRAEYYQFIFKHKAIVILQILIQISILITQPLVTIIVEF